MGSELQIFHVEEIAEAMGDAPFGSNLKNTHYTESGALVVQGKNVQGRSFDWSDKRHVSIEKWASLPRSQCQPGDLIFPKVGTIGKVGILSECDGYENYILSTNTMRLRVDQTKADSRFVYYFFTAPSTVNLIHALNSKSVQPVFNFTTLKRFQIDLPPLPEQKAIAHILGTLDDKIELNRRMNATLEGMAQALFKSWFVDFDPVIDNALAAGNPIPDELAARAEVRRQALAKGTANREAAKPFPAAFQQTESMGWIPEGWEVNTIEEIADRVAMGPFGSSIKVSTFVDVGIPVISGQHLKETTLDDNTYRYVTEDHAEKLKRSNVYRGDIIFTHAGNIGQVALIPESSKYERYVISQRQFYLRCDLNKASPLYLTYFFKSTEGQHVLLANASQVGVPSISRPSSYLRTITISNPSELVRENFDSITTDLLRKKTANKAQIESLTKLRNTLLPKLISGELRIPDAKKPTKEAI